MPSGQGSSTRVHPAPRAPHSGSQRLPWPLLLPARGLYAGTTPGTASLIPALGSGVWVVHSRPVRRRRPAGRPAALHRRRAVRSASMGPTSGYHPAVEEYLETILELEESGIPPMRARIVERLGVSAPAVSETVKRLEREGYLVLDERRRLRLTDTGRRYATSIMRRHRLAERLLVDILHVPWSEVHEEAGRLEARDLASAGDLPRQASRRSGDLPARQPHSRLGQSPRPRAAGPPRGGDGRQRRDRLPHRRALGIPVRADAGPRKRRPAARLRVHRHRRGPDAVRLRLTARTSGFRSRWPRTCT